MGNSFAANIFIDGPTKPGTVYLTESGYEINEVTSENKRGYIQIFPTAILHKVNPVQSERISVGITLHFGRNTVDHVLKQFNDANEGLIILREDGMIV